jgi:thioredoxin 1
MIEVIKFGADWCGPCRMMKPTMDSLSEKYNIEGSDIKITDVNVDENPDLSNLHKIKSIPTLIFLVDEKVIAKYVGVMKTDDIEKKINELKQTV